MSANNGLTGALEATTLPIAMTISAFTAIAWYNVIDLNVVIWMTFKRRHGLYFYSLLGASWGIAIFALAFLMKFFNIWTNPYVSCVFITIGWYAMVTGQSLVLYSRLHLVVHNKRNVRWVLYMIICSVFLFHFPTTVMTFGANSEMADVFATPYSIMEKVQVTAFCIQEFIISGLYVYATRQILKPGGVFQKKRTRQVMLHLIYVNVLVILMDITLLCTEYANLYEIQITFKSALYSVKLRLEFAVLNQLRSLVFPGDSGGQHSSSNHNHQSRARDDVVLATLQDRGHQGDDIAQSRNYTCFASGERHPSPFSRRSQDDTRVMMTTEVVVKTEDASKKEQGAVTRTDIVANGSTTRQNGKVSPNSSEVDFANRGY
ncbi:Uncharacterized protein BP5553_10002 [Venustampulla echinocandica]|uniref:DUF7703 domain-containing protein n=1 Tax=Venustampulla echinocandica TaxID=2656787 RepID=A0A370TA11_9HELO|nr:Uncharacterized protein BP5553_10002 [Venustampulla echinocandica]RDL30657.1 Uncharacterized protein BP5553_10002 [Venustampulla echinocandica]